MKIVCSIHTAHVRNILIEKAATHRIQISVKMCKETKTAEKKNCIPIGKWLYGGNYDSLLCSYRGK